MIYPKNYKNFYLSGHLYQGKNKLGFVRINEREKSICKPCYNNNAFKFKILNVAVVVLTLLNL